PAVPRRRRRLGAGPEQQPEEARRAAEVSLPERVTRVLGQPRMKDAGHLGTSREPLRHAKGGSLVVAQAHRQGPEPPKRLVTDVRRWAVPKRRRPIADRAVELLGPRRDRPQQ